MSGIRQSVWHGDRRVGRNRLVPLRGDPWASGHHLAVPLSQYPRNYVEFSRAKARENCERIPTTPHFKEVPIRLAKSMNGEQTVQEFAANEANFVRRLGLKPRPLNVSVRISVRTVSAGGLLSQSVRCR